jgi:hypothetical protein
MRRHRFLTAGVLLLVPALADAQRFQRGDRDRDRERPIGSTRGAFGIGFNYGQPVGDFHDYVEQGFGVDGFFRWNGDPRGIFSLRVEGGFLGYGRETKRVPLSSTIGGRILVDLTTSNNIVWLGLGPQLTIPMPGVRPYLNASAGFSYFFTESTVEGSNNNEDFASTTNYDDGGFAWGGGGGILIPFRTKDGEFAIDFGVRYHGNGEMSYLRENGIEDIPGGGIRLHPIRSEANLVTYRLGFAYAFR